MTEHLHLFADLYAGRTDVFGGDSGMAIHEPVTIDTYRLHLEGVRPIGIYPVVERDGGFHVAWGGVDIDFNDIGLAHNLWLVLEQMGCPAWVEMSRSKGFHVLTFAADWVSALTMRQAILAVCQVVGYTPKEVYPKQAELSPDKPYGNYLRLPYPRFGVMGRQVMLDMTLPSRPPIRFQEWVEAAHARRVQPAAIAQVAGLYKPMPERKHIQIREYTGSMRALVDALKQARNGGYQIFLEGPLEGSDRSGTLVRLAGKCQDAGFTAGEALAIVTDADQRWGKFDGRADAEQRLEDVVFYVYG